jgi:23S rRNA (adenine2503-C2)-methyltransferase
MKIVATTGHDEIARVYVGQFPDGEYVEFVEAVQPPISREEKWVLMVSTLYGCPVECEMCDAGGYYHGKVSKERIFAQIDHLIEKRYPDGNIPCAQLKIQFARMGEPSFNPAVLAVLREFPSRFHAPGFMPSISTIAPYSADAFFEELLQIKDEHYLQGQFQFQFSIHTTDHDLRDEIIPVKKWDFNQMAEYGDRFYKSGDRKITLNFALAQGHPVDSAVLLKFFDPEKYLIKITPLNPTYRALENGLSSYVDAKAGAAHYEVVEALKGAGYQVIVSIGEAEENLIGSNCGQYVLKHLRENEKLQEGYLYEVVE